MRFRLDEKQLFPGLSPFLSDPLGSEFASLSAKIRETLEKLDGLIIATEEALAAVEAMRDVEKTANGEAQRS